MERALAKRFVASLKLVTYVAVAWCLETGSSRAGAPPPAPGVVDNEAIIVTAQRRPERAEDVPISLTARSGEELERLQATDTTSLERVVPSLVMTRTSVFAQPFLRGVGKRSNLGVENSVATYVDGVYLASPISALLDLRGIERVEMLERAAGNAVRTQRDGRRDPGGHA